MPTINKQIDCIQMSTKSGARAIVSLHGAQLLSWVPAACDEEQLYLSKLAVIDGSSAIRGGVPVLFPHFGAQADSPNHGFARLVRWSLVSRISNEASDVATLELLENDKTKLFFQSPFNLSLTITLFDSSVRLAYDVVNTGDDSFYFSGGLHTYFSTLDISKTTLSGLKECSYLENGSYCEQSNQLLEVSSEVDRAYFTGDEENRLKLSSQGRSIEIESSGFNETVVWNPWVEGAKQINDMANDDYLTMLCVESVVATKKIHLHSGCTWSGSQWLKYKKQ